MNKLEKSSLRLGDGITPLYGTTCNINRMNGANEFYLRQISIISRRSVQGWWGKPKYPQKTTDLRQAH